MNEKDSERLHTFKVTHLGGLESEDKLRSHSKAVFCVCSCIMPTTVFELIGRGQMYEQMDRKQMYEHGNCTPGLNVRNIDVLVDLLFLAAYIFMHRSIIFKTCF